MEGQVVAREARHHHPILVALVIRQALHHLKETMVELVRPPQDLEAVVVEAVHPQSGLLEHLVAVEMAALERHLLYLAHP
jgi:hypothetical protein